MNQSQANGVCAGDEVRNMAGHRCRVLDLYYGIDSDGESVIVARVQVTEEGHPRETMECPLLLCELLEDATNEQ